MRDTETNQPRSMELALELKVWTIFVFISNFL